MNSIHDSSVSCFHFEHILNTLFDFIINSTVDYV